MKKLLTSCFGLGYMPIAPGTWGSLPVAAIFFAMGYFAAGAGAVFSVMLGLVVAASVVCVLFSPAIIERLHNKDPRQIVADEVAGQAVTFLIIGAAAFENLYIAAIMGFLWFRVFDVLKPYPIRKLEKLPQGWGILADDLLAGVYAGVAARICIATDLVGYLKRSLAFSGGEGLNVIKAGFLGLVQGLTEFLPVSSSGHLVVLEHFFGFDSERPEMLVFDLVLHLGTVCSIFIVFRRDISKWLGDLASCGKYGNTPLVIYRRSPSVHLLVLGIVSTIVTGVLGLLFEDVLKQSRGSVGFVAAMWIFTGTMLIITDYSRKSRLGLREFGVGAAVIVGLAQAVAILPGVSRSGATICAAILIGLHRRWAVEYSFLLAIPAIFGATIVEMIKNYEQIRGGNLEIGSLLAGAAVAAIVGIFALKLLIGVSRRAKLKYFGFYSYMIAGFVVFYLLYYGRF